MTPTINYIWVGPPPKETGGEPGHDITGPIEMAHCNKTNPMVFWCLDKYAEKYRALLKNSPTIQVRGIESHLAEEFKNDDIQQAAKDTKDIITLHLQPERNTIRDKVSVKNIFSLFLLRSQGGYVLDTNVVPADKHKVIELPAYRDFHIPAFTLPANSGADIDYWIMFSPPQNAAMSEAFLLYLQEWNATQKIYDREKYSTSYHDALGGIISQIFFNNELANTPIHYWKTIETDKSANIAFVEELKLHKYYFNTHHKDARTEFDREALQTQKVLRVTGRLFPPKAVKILAELDPNHLGLTTKPGFTYSQIYFDILANNTAGLESRIAAGADINQQMKNPLVLGETPLHQAISLNHTECVKILLAHGADPTLEVAYLKRKAMNAYTQAEQPGINSEIKKALAEHKLAQQNKISPSK